MNFFMELFEWLSLVNLNQQTYYFIFRQAYWFLVEVVDSVLNHPLYYIVSLYVWNNFILLNEGEFVCVWKLHIITTRITF